MDSVVSGHCYVVSSAAWSICCRCELQSSWLAFINLLFCCLLTSCTLCQVTGSYTCIQSTCSVLRFTHTLSVLSCTPHVVLVRDPYNLLTDVKESIFVLKLLLLLLYFLPVTLSPCFSLSFYSCSLFISLIYLAYTYLRTYLLQLL